MSKPIVIFDAETTGADPVQDRVVQLAAVKCSPMLDSVDQQINVFINPKRPISPSAIEVHGITDEQVRNKPMFCEMAPALFDFLSGCDYAGFNITQFDVPLLSEEFGRCGMSWPAPGALFLDAYHIFREKEKRDLPSALKFYCGREHVNAHDAMGDILATRDVLLRQMWKYDDLRTPDKIAAFCSNPNALDLAGKIIWDNGVAVYSFGKDRGKSVKDFPGFGKWMLGQSFAANTKAIVRALIGNEI